MTKRSWLTFIPLVVFLLLVAVFVIALKHSGGDEHKFAQHVNEPVPATELGILNAAPKSFSTRSMLGHAYIVNFFASWCVPCRSEHDNLLQLAEEDGITIIGVAYKDQPAAIAAFLNKDGNPYRAVADDSSGRAGIDWGITGVPETFIVDAKGIIRYHAVGPMTGDKIERELLPVWHEVKE